MVDKDMSYIHEVIGGYRPDVEILIKYIPWLESKMGTIVSNLYKGDGIGEHSMSFPIYDSTLMSLVKDAKRTDLLDKNYAYIYSRNHIKNAGDEQRLIETATIREMDMLKGILSRYILGGMIKGTLWTEGVNNGSLLKVLLKMKEIIEYWDRPLEQNKQGIN